MVAVQRYFLQIIQGLHYLHGKQIAHRDLKPENLLISDDNQIRIADFGLSAVCVDHEQQPKWFDTACGTRKYCAPELLQGGRYLAKPVDIWAAAVILFVLAQGRFPFGEASQCCDQFRAASLGCDHSAKWCQGDQCCAR